MVGELKYEVCGSNVGVMTLSECKAGTCYEGEKPHLHRFWPFFLCPGRTLMCGSEMDGPTRCDA